MSFFSRERLRRRSSTLDHSLFWWWVLRITLRCWSIAVTTGNSLAELGLLTGTATWFLKMSEKCGLRFRKPEKERRKLFLLTEIDSSARCSCVETQSLSSSGTPSERSSSYDNSRFFLSNPNCCINSENMFWLWALNLLVLPCIFHLSSIFDLKRSQWTL